MPQQFTRAQPKLAFVPQTYNPLLVNLIHTALPLLLRIRTRPWLPAGIGRVQALNEDALCHLYQKFQAGQIRLIIAFRHVEVDDPLCGLYLLSRAVPQAAQRLGVSLEMPLHAHFVYDRGMSLWAGKGVIWLFARIGGIPIRRGRHPDWQGLRVMRHLLINGHLPLAIAPEGGTNGHSGRVGPLEPGVAQLGFWGLSDLQRAHRTEDVVIVPIGIQYQYRDPPWQNLEKLLTELEDESGLSLSLDTSFTSDNRTTFCYRRLLRLGDHLLSKLEELYGRFRHQPLPIDLPSLSLDLTQEQRLAARLHQISSAALEYSEQYLGLTPQGNLIDRCRRIEEAGWASIYREDIEDLRQLSPLDRGLADWIAAEASLQMLPMRLVESIVAISGTYVQENPTVERLCEMALILYDVLSRLKGDKIPARPWLGWREAVVTVGEPISVTQWWSDYRKDRRQAVSGLTQELKAALERTIA